MPFIETSAKNSTNVQELFERIAIEIKKNSLKLPINTNNLNRIQKQTNKSKCDC
jgi:predicted GTPase